MLEEVSTLKFESKKFFLESSNGIYKVHGKFLFPTDGEIKGIIQFSHGMCEYIDKYSDFFEYMVKKGFVVVGHDHIGHGDSINTIEDRGYFGEKDGYKSMIEDLKKVTDMIKCEFQNKPLFIVAHSMGSLIARCYAAKYGNELTGLILCGTVGPNPLAKAGIRMSNLIADKKGERYRSNKLFELSLKYANIKFMPAKTRFDWATSDESEVGRHVRDEKGNFVFTARGFNDLFHLVLLANSDKVIKTVPKRLPIIFMSGDNDPIGENGSGVERAVKKYKDLGLMNIRIKLYEGKRHELLKEINKHAIYEDIYKWICVQLNL